MTAGFAYRVPRSVLQSLSGSCQVHAYMQMLIISIGPDRGAGLVDYVISRCVIEDPPRYLGEKLGIRSGAWFP